MKNPSIEEGRTGAGQQGLTVGFVLYAVNRWWKWAVPLGVLLAAGAAAPIYLTFQPEYEASAYVSIKRSSPGILEELDLDPNAVNTHVQMIRSPRVLRVVTSDPKVAVLPEVRNSQDKMSVLLERLRVKSEGTSELFLITYRGTSPEGSAHVANAVVNTFLQLQGEIENTVYFKVIHLLKDELAKRGAEVKDLQELVRAETIKLTGKDPQAQVAANPKGSNGLETTRPVLSELQLRMIEAEVKQTMLEAQIKAAERWSAEATPQEPPALIVDQAVSEDPDVAKSTDSVEEQRLAIADLSAVLRGGKNNPLYQQKFKELQAAEKRLADLRKVVAERVKKEMEVATVAERNAQIEGMRSDASSYAYLREDLKAKYEEEIKNRKEYEGETFDLAVMQGDLSRAEEVFWRIADRIEALETERPAPSPVQLWDPAVRPDAPIESLPYKQLALAIVAAFCAPFAGAVGWEFLHRRIANAEQLTHHLQAPVIAEVASLPTRTIGRRRFSRRQIMGVHCFRESIDSLRTGLTLSEPLENLHVIAVVSAVSEEGKTSVASQLALSLARATGEPTLLIDGDIRSPDIHEIYETALSPGLADVLEGKERFEDAVTLNAKCGLHVLPAGKSGLSPHALFGSSAFGELIAEARKSYRFVVLDTPPVLPASEALVQAQFADACVICARVDHSRAAQVAVASNRMRRAGLRIVGAALIGVGLRSYYYRYGGYYYGA